MNRRLLIATVSVIAVIAITATVYGVAFGFTAETYNNENNYTAEPTAIAARATNSPSGALLKVGLPAPTEGDGYTGSGPWVLSVQSGVVNGYLEIRCPGGVDGTGNMRVWMDVKYPEVWSIVQRMTLRIDGDSREYVLFGADSELLEVGGEPNRILIPVTTHTGNNNLLGFRLIVSYKTELTVNPQAIMGDDYSSESRLQIVQKILTSRLNFALAESDPIGTLKVNYIRGSETLQTVEAYKGNVLLPPSFSGYNIEGWYVDPGFAEGSRWDFPSYHVDERYWEEFGIDAPEAGYNLYAKDAADPTTYTLTYELNGGTAANPETYNVLTDSFVLNNPTKANYEFIGWTGTGLSERAMTVTVEKGSTGNRSYTANWSGNTYTIAFDKNSGTGSMESITDAVYGTPEVLTKNTFVKDGYTFAGWDGNNDGRVDYFDESSVYFPVSLTNNKMTLKAIWTDHDVTFSDGGTPTPETYTVKGFNGYILPECRFNSPLLGKTFVAWNIGGSMYNPEDVVDLSTVDTVTAEWGFTLSYSSNGGNGTPPSRIAAMPGTELTVSDQGRISRLGFTFTGWNTSRDGTGMDYAPGSTLTMPGGGGSVVLYAVWKCTLTYHANGGTGSIPDPVVEEIGGSATVAAKPGDLVKEGCTFHGWNTRSNGSGTYYSADSSITLDTDTQLYAIWDCTVVFNSNGAESGSAPSGGTFVCNEHLPIPGNTGSMVKSGYSFGGWNTRADGTGDTYLAGSSMTLESSITFYAMWGHIVHFHLGGIDDDMEQFVFDGMEAVEPDMEYDDYDFKGWFRESSFVNEYDFDDPVTANLNLYAKWVVTVYFICNDGSNSPDQRQEFVFNTTAAIDNEKVPLNANANVTGWNTRSDYSGVYYPKTELTPRTNLGLYAVWNYHVTYYANGGRGDVPTDSNSYPISGTGKATIQEKPEGLYRNGCTFREWNTARDGSGSSPAAGDKITVSGNVTLYAIWNCGVVYDANGATGGSVPTDSNTYEADISIVTVLGNTGSLVKDGSTFSGWNTRADGTGTTYQAADTFTVKGATTLYAVWRCTLTYDGNGSTEGSVPTPVDIDSGTSVTLKPHGDLKKDGLNYVFMGWNTSSDGTGDMYNEGDAFYITGNTTLYAIWGHTISFDNNGGSGVMSNQYVQHGVDTTLNPMKFIAPYMKEFDHWDTLPDGTGADYADKGVVNLTENTILYAIWKVKA